MNKKGAIGVFDSGFGGLTVLKSIQQKLPNYNFMYLGDNARTPYGNRSYETVYTYTWQCVEWLFKQNCNLVIVACNTASAKALRSIQQNNLQQYSNKKVLGVIRPTAEVIGNYSTTKNIGVLATTGTVLSNSYVIEIDHFFPDVKVFQQECPMLVPLIESGEHNNETTHQFIKQYINQLQQKCNYIDTILLGCTHYPIIANAIKSIVSANVNVIEQGNIVANSLVDYLKRHPEIDEQCLKNNTITFYTTDAAQQFEEKATLFYGKKVEAKQVVL